MGNEDAQTVLPDHNVSPFSVRFWKGKKMHISLEPHQKKSMTFKSASDTTVNPDELEIHRSSLKMRKVWIDLSFCEHRCEVVRPWSELAHATLRLACLRYRPELSEGWFGGNPHVQSRRRLQKTQSDESNVTVVHTELIAQRVFCLFVISTLAADWDSSL